MSDTNFFVRKNVYKTYEIINENRLYHSMDASFLKVFSVILSLLFFIGVFRVVFNGEDISFYRLILFFKDMPQIPIDWITSFSQLRIDVLIQDWGIFQWLADGVNFITNFFIDIISFSMYITVGFGNLIVFAGYVVGYLLS